MTVTFFKPTALRMGLVLAACAGLAACGSAAGMSQSNPDYFYTRIKDGQMTGKYNPAGFKQDEVRKLLQSNCQGKALASYGEQAADGLMVFSATCKGGFVNARAGIEYERAGSTVVAEMLGADSNGNIVTNRSDIAL